MLSRRGISFGQTCAQLPALLQSATPPGPIRTSRRSAFSALPVGWSLKSRAWADDGGADEMVARRVLRARLEAAATADAPAQRVLLFLQRLRLRRAGTEVVSAVDRNPGFDPLQIVEQAAAIHRQVTDHRELTQRLERDRLIQLVHQRGAGLPGFAVYDHRARAADLFQTPALPDGRRRLRPVGGGRSGGDGLQDTRSDSGLAGGEPKIPPTAKGGPARLVDGCE